MNIILSTTVLASVFSPAFSFSYLDQLSGAPAVVAPVAVPAPPAPVAAAPAPVAAAPVPVSDTSAAVAVGNYMDSLFNAATATSGPGIQTHLDGLPSNSAPTGSGMQTYTAALPAVNTSNHGTGMISHTDALSGGAVARSSPVWGASKSPSFSGSTSGESVAFTLSTGNLSGLVDALNGGGTITLSGSIDSVSIN